MEPSGLDDTDNTQVIDAKMPAHSQPKPFQDDVKPTAKGVENAKKRLRAFSIQKKSQSPVQVIPPKPICTPVGAVGTVFIGRLASTKQTLKPGEIDEVPDPKKLPKPPKPGTSKLQNADYLNIQKKTLAEIEDMKRKMELVDLGIPLGLICPTPNSDKAMPTKAMPPIKSMMLARKFRVLRPLKKEAKKILQKLSCNAGGAKNPAKVDEIICEAKKAKAEGKQFKFNYEKLLPLYENPFARKKDKSKDKEPLSDDHRASRDRQRYSDNSRRYFSHQDDKKRDRDRYRVKDKRANIIRVRQERELHIKHKGEKSKTKYTKARDMQSKDHDVKSKDRDSKSNKNSKPKDKIDTINLSDEDDNDVQEVIAVLDNDVKETDVNLKDFVVCDSWSENEDKSKDATPKADKKAKDAKTTPSSNEPMEQLKQSLLKTTEPPEEVKLEKLQPVTDSFKFEIEDVNNDEELDMFSEDTALQKFATIISRPITVKRELQVSPMAIRNEEGKDSSADGMDESFLESVIAEIKQEAIDENTPQHFDNKGLVEYDPSPNERESITPELDDKIRELCSNRSDFSDGYKSVESVKSTESGFKSIESGYKSTESGYKSIENRYKTENRQKERKSRKTERSKSDDCRSKSSDSHKSETSYKSTGSERKVESKKSKLKAKRTEEAGMAKAMMDSLETWTFVMKICQPLLFRHDKHKCYKETCSNPKVWFAENPKLCDCVKDRSVVYDELEMCKMDLVDSLYNSARVQEAIYADARGWYPSDALVECGSVALCSEWEADDSQERPTTPPQDEMLLDREYQKFMEAVWPEVEEPRSETPRCTPLREDKKRAAEEPETGKKKKKMKIEGKVSSEGWSQESEVDEEVDRIKRQKVVKVKRKRKHSTSLTDAAEESSSKKKKKMQKKEKKEISKVKATKRQRLSKKYIKKLKEKQVKQLKKKKKQLEEEIDEQERERKKRERKLKKKKLLKQKKKNVKKKKAKSSSSSSSDSESDRKSKKKEKRKKHKKRKQSTSESTQSEELFDVNILKNIKTERLTDDEKKFSPNKIHRQIINVKELQDDFVIQIKKEVDDVNSPEQFEKDVAVEKSSEIQADEKGDENKEEGSKVNEVKESQPVEEDDTIEEQEPPRPPIPQLQPTTQQILPTTQIQLPAPQIHLPTPHIQTPTQQIHSPIPQIHTPLPQIHLPTTQIQTQTPQIHNPIPQINTPIPQIHIPTPQIQLSSSQIHSPIPQIHIPSPQIHVPFSQIHSPISQILPITTQISTPNPPTHIAIAQIPLPSPQEHLEEINSQSSQESVSSAVGHYEKDTSHLRPSSQNSNYTFHDVMEQNEATHSELQSEHYAKGEGLEMEGEYPRGNYEMYEQMAMEYQSDVASQRVPPPDSASSGRIETVVGAPRRGEIKCDWRAGDKDADRAGSAPARPSRWGLKPSEVNIVLTGGSEGGEQYPIRSVVDVVEPTVYRIQSIANRTENSNTGYDEAYMDTYGASDRLQYGDCFSHHSARLDTNPRPAEKVTSSLDERIYKVLAEVEKNDGTTANDASDNKGILVTKSLTERSVKRVSFADGYQPGQDSDTEDPPVRKKKKVRRAGCPWPCPAEHPDHVPLWDALPPPPPPAGSPPPPAAPRAPPAHLLREGRRHNPMLGLQAPHHMSKFDPSSMSGFMPPEPPPGLISF